MSNPSDTQLWIVVKVESGIPVEAEAYQSRKSARTRLREMRVGMNNEQDETGLFLCQVGVPDSEPVQ